MRNKLKMRQMVLVLLSIPILLFTSCEKKEVGHSFKKAHDFFSEITLIVSNYNFKVVDTVTEEYLNIYSFGLDSDDSFSKLISINIDGKVKYEIVDSCLKGTVYPSNVFACNSDSPYVYIGILNDIYEFDYISRKIIRNVDLKKFGFGKDAKLANYLSINNGVLTFFVEQEGSNQHNIMINWDINTAPSSCVRNSKYWYDDFYIMNSETGNCVIFTPSPTKIPFNTFSKNKSIFNYGKIDYIKGRGWLFSGLPENNDKIIYINNTRYRKKLECRGYSATFGSDNYIYFLNKSNLWRVSLKTSKRELVFKTNKKNKDLEVFNGYPLIYTKDRNFLAYKYVTSDKPGESTVIKMAVFDLKNKQYYIIANASYDNFLLVTNRK